MKLLIIQFSPASVYLFLSASNNNNNNNNLIKKTKCVKDFVINLNDVTMGNLCNYSLLDTIKIILHFVFGVYITEYETLSKKRTNLECLEVLKNTRIKYIDT
jgi:hypothetical protein